MSCIYCTNYQGRDEPCFKGVTVQTLNESIDCEDYCYDGSCKVE